MVEYSKNCKELQPSPVYEKLPYTY